MKNMNHLHDIQQSHQTRKHPHKNSPVKYINWIQMMSRTPSTRIRFYFGFIQVMLLYLDFIQVLYKKTNLLSKKCPQA